MHQMDRIDRNRPKWAKMKRIDLNRPKWTEIDQSGLKWTE